ncbi:hypothetical protein BH11BAC7_BH11BAC7_30970 [soil metagenome]
MSNYSQYLIPALFVLLIARKVKGSIGFQKFAKARLIIRICLFSFVALMLLTTAALHPISYISDFVGALLGFGLLYWAMKLTIFENREAGLYYRTNIWIEVTIIALFLIRFISRFPLFYGTFSNAFSGKHETPGEVKAKLETLRDPYTGALIFVMIAYYIGYSAFILKKAPAAKTIETGQSL